MHLRQLSHAYSPALVQPARWCQRQQASSCSEPVSSLGSCSVGTSAKLDSILAKLDIFGVAVKLHMRPTSSKASLGRDKRFRSKLLSYYQMPASTASSDVRSGASILQTVQLTKRQLKRQRQKQQRQLNAAAAAAVPVASTGTTSAAAGGGRGQQGAAAAAAAAPVLATTAAGAVARAGRGRQGAATAAAPVLATAAAGAAAASLPCMVTGWCVPEQAIVAGHLFPVRLKVRCAKTTHAAPVTAALAASMHLCPPVARMTLLKCARNTTSHICRHTATLWASLTSTVLAMGCCGTWCMHNRRRLAPNACFAGLVCITALSHTLCLDLQV